MRQSAPDASRFLPLVEGLHAQPDITDLDATSDDDAWVVGYNGGYPSGNASFTSHWDGSTWTTVPSDPGTVIDPALTAVAEVAPDDVWAVGVNYRSGLTETDNLAMHWDGDAWSYIPMPQPGGEYRALTRVGVVSGDQVYASGQVCESGEGPCAREVFRYDGMTWTQVTHPPVRLGPSLSCRGSGTAAAWLRSP